MGQSLMIIYSKFFVEVHQVLHCVILFSKPLALLNLFHQQCQGLIQKQKVDIDGKNSDQINVENRLYQPLNKDPTKNVYVRSISERALLNPRYITNFTTKNGVKNLPPGMLWTNILITNKSITNDSIRKEQILDFKKRQRKKE